MLQSSQVLSFFRPRENGGDWSQRELAEFYRVEEALISSGVGIATDRGLTDEGEPWFVFYRQDNEEVIVHFARIDGEYIVVSNLTEGVARGRNFQLLVRELLESHPYVLPKSGSRRQTVYLHPATLLAALVVTGYVKSAEVNANSDDHVREDKGLGWLFNRHDLVTYSAIIMAAVWDSLAADRSEGKSDDLILFEDARADHDLAASTVAIDSSENNAFLGDLVFKNTHDGHSVLAATTLDFQERAGAFNDGAARGVVVAPTKSVADQTALHSGDNEMSVPAHDVSRSDNDGNGKVEGWHLDQATADLMQTNLLVDRIVVVKSGSSSPLTETVSESHNSSSASISPIVTSQTPTFADVSGAQTVLSSLLHLDPQDLHPVVLSATNITDAVHTTLVDLTTNGIIASAPTVDIVSPTSSTTANVSSSPPLFDDAARTVLNNFLHDTAQVRVESFGNDWLIVDTNVSHFASNDFRVETWAMSDGSTLSILGIVPHHDTAMAA